MQMKVISIGKVRETSNNIIQVFLTLVVLLVPINIKYPAVRSLGKRQSQEKEQCCFFQEEGHCLLEGFTFHSCYIISTQIDLARSNYHFYSKRKSLISSRTWFSSIYPSFYFMQRPREQPQLTQRERLVLKYFR